MNLVKGSGGVGCGGSGGYELWPVHSLKTATCSDLDSRWWGGGGAFEFQEAC